MTKRKTRSILQLFYDTIFSLQICKKLKYTVSDKYRSHFDRIWKNNIQGIRDEVDIELAKKSYCILKRRQIQSSLLQYHYKM